MCLCRTDSEQITAATRLNETAPVSFLCLFLRQKFPHILHLLQCKATRCHQIPPLGKWSVFSYLSVRDKNWGSHSHLLGLHTHYIFVNTEVIFGSTSSEHPYQQNGLGRLWSLESRVTDTFCWDGNTNKTMSQKEFIVHITEFSGKLPLISSHPLMALSYVCNLSLNALSGAICQGVATPLFRGLLITWCNGTSVWSVWAEIADAAADLIFGEMTTKIKRKHQLSKQPSFSTNLQVPAKTQTSSHLSDAVWEDHTVASQASGPAGRIVLKHTTNFLHHSGIEDFILNWFNFWQIAALAETSRDHCISALHTLHPSGEFVLYNWIPFKLGNSLVVLAF